MRNMVTLHQPNYIPWIGLFSKISQTDCLVVMDTVQYIKRGITHRNKIRVSTGSSYLTIPISKAFAMSKINEVELPTERIWRKDHWRCIRHNYLKTDYFQQHMAFFNDIYKEDFRFLWQLNMKIIHYLLKAFDINVEVIMVSDLGLDPDLKGTDLIIEILKKVEARCYLSGPSGKGYLDTGRFKQNDIELKFAGFQHPVYKQRYPGFEPELSAIDLLFNMGPASGQIIRAAGSIEKEPLTVP
jgi:hypothetical protein